MKATIQEKKIVTTIVTSQTRIQTKVKTTNRKKVFSLNVRREVNPIPHPPLDTHDDYKNTDAYRNTMKHFEGLDKQKGKSRGHHFDEFKKEKERAGSRYDGNNNALQDKPEPIMNKAYPQTDQFPLTRLNKNLGVYDPSRPPPPPPPPRSSLPVAFGNDPIRNKKYQEYIIRKKKLLARKEKIRLRGGTDKFFKK